MPDKAFATQIWKHDQLEGCAFSDSTCLDRWSTITGTSFDYVYVRSSEGVYPVAESLMSDYRYDLIYNGPGAMIFVHH